MTPSTPEMKVLFLEAIERPEGSERAAYLDGACRGDASLRAQLDELLVAHDRAGGFLASAAETSAGVITAGDAPTYIGEETAAIRTSPPTTAGHGSGDATAGFGPAPAPDGSASPRPIAEGPGSCIGLYRLLHKLGEGGMGAVFLAQQDRPVRRQVALKVIKPGMDTEQVVARFEAERQALAIMDHPSIAKVFDAGATDSGRPYFVMEPVDGVPINEFCDQARLSPRRRLELFVVVCQAIQHAHQKGIIHRDIKPSNVLVTLVDGRPTPKVIDFGVAKAVDQRLTERTLFTQLGALVGTPEYMSPEQADFSGAGIDTRSDIYALGVLLYELLTGTTPLGRIRLREAAFSEVLRRIREEEPVRPSTRLGDSDEALASIAACRDVEPARLARLVRGDLDWIAMKALEKERGRRYATAQELGRDVQRHLDGDPVEAGPPSWLYRAGKFARKHRAAFATAAALAVMLVLASVVSTVLMLRARSAERLSERRLGEAERAHQETMKALVETDRARALARGEADKARAVNDFLTDDLLTQAEPANNAAEDHVELVTVLDRAAEKVGARFAGRPEVEDALRRTIAETYHGLASWEKAERQWRAVHESARRRLGPESAEALTALNQLAHILRHRGRFDAALLGMAQSASDGLERVLGPSHPDTLASRNNLTNVYLDAGRLTQSIALGEPTLERLETKLGPDHHHTIVGRGNLAAAYLKVGRTAEAIALYEDNLKRQVTKLGPDHPDTLLSRGNLASAYLAARRFAEAIAIYEDNLKWEESKLGPDHPDTLLVRNNLAVCYISTGRYAEALKLLETVFKLQERELGPDHPDTLRSRHNLASAHHNAGRMAEAIPLFEANLRLAGSRLGPEHPGTMAARNGLAEAYRDSGRIAEAVALHEANLKLLESKLGPEHPRTLATMNGLVWAYLAARRWPEAEAMAFRCLERREKAQPDDWETFSTRSQLGGSLLGRAEFAEAEPLIVAGYEGMKAREASIPVPSRPRLGEAARRVVELYEAWGKPDKAAGWRAKLGLAELPADVFEP